MDIMPTTHFLASVRADRGSYSTLLAEAIDNSLDAAASRVDCDLLSNKIAIVDDGVGITRDRCDAIVRLGAHGKMSTTKLGTFGIGVKYQAVGAGDTMAVRSFSRDGEFTLFVDWSAVARSGKWEINEPDWDVNASGRRGTEIVIAKLRWGCPREKDVEEARKRLALMFHPALSSGRVVTLNGEGISAFREPSLTDIVEGKVELKGGKGAVIRAGILADKGCPLYQVHVSYQHRVIMPASTFGCGDTPGGLRQMFARVALIGPWGFERFKNEIVDEDEEELEERTNEILRPILEKCSSSSMAMKFNRMAELLNDMVPENLRPARPLKKNPGNSKKKKRQNESNECKEGDEMKGGPSRTRTRAKGVVITFDEPLVGECGYGKFQPGRPNRVVLAADNPHVKLLMQNRDEEVGRNSLFAIAAMIYQHDKYPEDPAQTKIEDCYKPFGLSTWELAAGQGKTMDADVK